MASYNNELEESEINPTEETEYKQRPKVNENNDKENSLTHVRRGQFDTWKPKSHSLFGGGDCSISLPKFSEGQLSCLEQIDMNIGKTDFKKELKLGRGDVELSERGNRDEKTENQGSGDTSPTPSDGLYLSVRSNFSLISNTSDNQIDFQETPTLENKSKAKDVHDDDQGSQDTGTTETYESASENEAEQELEPQREAESADFELEIEVVSDDEMPLTQVPIISTEQKNESSAESLIENIGDNVSVGQGFGNGTISSPMAINWDDFHFSSHEQNSSMCVNYDSFMTPTSSKRQRLSMRPQLSDSESPGDSPLTSSRSAPPDLSTDSIEQRSEECLESYKSSGVTEGSPRIVPRTYLSSPLQASTPSNGQPLNRNPERQVVPLDNETSSVEKSNSLHTISTNCDGDSTETAGNDTGLPGSNCNSTGSIGTVINGRKRSSVTFDLNPVDIEEAMISRPQVIPKEGYTTTKMSPAHSILVNAGTEVYQQQNMFNGSAINSSTESDDDESEEGGTTKPLIMNAVIVDELKMADVRRQADELILRPQAQEYLNGSDPNVNVAKSEENGFPISVTELVAENGVKVYIIGTTRFSSVSQKDVIETIRKVEPKFVLLELNEDRRSALTVDERFYHKGFRPEGEDNAISQYRKESIFNTWFDVVLTTTSERLTQHLGVTPGAEFRIAAQEAIDIPDCRILLADRRYEVTIGRLVGLMGFFQKVKLFRWMWMNANCGVISPGEFRRFKEMDLVDRMLSEMVELYPETAQIIDERDKYLSYQLRQASISAKDGAIVGVFGLTHVPGILKFWGNVTAKEFDEISRIPLNPDRRRRNQIIRGTLLIVCNVVIGYGLYKLSKTILSSNSVSSRIRLSTYIPQKWFGKSS